MALMPFLRSCAGVHAKVDPVRLKYDPESGVQLLAQAVNVDIDSTGRVSRRKGLRLLAEVTAPHSLWSTADESRAFLISGNTLYRMIDDGTLMLVKTGLTPDAPCFYCEVNDKVYFSNGNEMGIISADGTWTNWGQTPYVGPTTDRQFTGPPKGTRLAFYRGRILIGKNDDKCIWYSEPINYGCFDSASGFFLFDSAVKMIAPVDSGIFESTDTAVYFLASHSNKEMEIRRVLYTPAIAGTDTPLNAQNVSPEFSGKAICFVVQKRGICLGLGNGTIIQLTQSKVDIPEASAGCSVIDQTNDYKFLTFLEI